MLEIFTSSVMSTNTTVIRSGDDVIVVDPAWTTAELGRIAAHVQPFRVVCGWATHAHHDHVLWHPGLGDPPRYATARAARQALEDQAALEQAATAHVAWELISLVARVEVFDGRFLPWDGPSVEVVAHNGHAPGHGALWVDEVKTLIAGDMLSDVEIPSFEDTDAEAYHNGLMVLEPYVNQAREIIPGHGRPTWLSDDSFASPRARWEADMAYVQAVAEGRGHEDSRIAQGPAWQWDYHHANLRSTRVG